MNGIVRRLCGVLGLIVLVLQSGCAPTVPMTANSEWEVTLLSASHEYGWHRVERFAGTGLLVVELKFHRLNSPQDISVSLSDIDLVGYNDNHKDILALSKDSATNLTINGVDASKIDFLYCEDPTFGDYACSYSVSAEGGLPDQSSLAQIDKVLKDPAPRLVLSASGDTITVALAFDDFDIKEDHVLVFRDLPAITFKAK